MKEMILYHPLISASVCVYATLLISQHTWWSFILGATAIVIISANIPKLEADALIRFLYMYVILFLFFLMPIAFLIQGEYGVKFVDKETYNYYTSYGN